MDIERDEAFDEFLDEIYPAVKVGDGTYSASTILYECDPIAYSVYNSDWNSETNE